MGTLLAKQQGSWPDLVHCFLVLTCFTQVVLLVPLGADNTTKPTHFMAAVYNHRTIMPEGPDKADRDYAKYIISLNLDVYEDQIRQAAKQGVNIIVFPEDGVIGTRFSRSDIYHYLEHVPDPDLVQVNPCMDFPDPDGRPIQTRLSCAAREHDMWVVVNTGSIVNCSRLTDPDCPSDGRYQFNTNIVFDNNGDLVARYHKRNLFYEFQFDMPKEVQYSVFETPYGKMGMFVCFDILFKEPAVDLVEEYGIQHALFPTAWRSIIPSMSGLGFHESWAIRFGVNLLSSEFHLPEFDWIGSAIYRGGLGADNFHNDYSFMSPGKLLVTRIPVVPVAPPRGLVTVPVPEVPVHQPNFTAVMESNDYTWLELIEDSGELYIHDQDTYCYLKYTMESRSEHDLYAFGIFEGQHYDYLNSYIQVCALVRCSRLDRASCGIPTRDAHTMFSELHISGRFSVDYIFPALLVDHGDVHKAGWEFMLDEDNSGGLITAMNLSRPLLSAILYTRDYSRDNNTGFERPPVSRNKEEVGEIDIENSVNMKTHKPDSTSVSTGRLSLIIIMGCVLLAIVGKASFNRLSKRNAYIPA